MLQQLWQSFITGIQRIATWILASLGFTISSTPAKTTNGHSTGSGEPPLDDSGYEFVFMQLLEGVNQGWEQLQVADYFAKLSHRTTEAGWIDWLQRFGDRLLEHPDSHHELASRLLKLGERQPGAIGAKATEVGRALLNKDFTPEAQPMTEDAETAFNRGNEYYQQGEYVTALSHWDRAIALKADLYQAWTNRGVALNTMKRYEEALSSYDRALAIQPDYDIAWSNRGVSLRWLGRYEEALESYDRAISLQPNTFDPWLNRGTVLSGLKRYEEALENFRHATEINPQRAEAWTGTARMLTLLQHYEEGVATWDEVLARVEHSADAWRQRGTCLYHLQRYEEALASCDRSLQLEPEDPETVSYWSKCQARLSALAAERSAEPVED
ncbi:tetratricopeptide repeat protein [Roseofilum casamattae]|uniref:Tetratricopeptide repeat protein n=1 Tax=Roseofilum casamattae BLCC-M143 TaxID=3022442 RepID=A0ABT7BWA1_9CYAN|nr:tetratricopeptide repeat protein [Roseofilum casamattae]MDJ1183451.1 tetratricopeptide repeat protein [Roseofilum casamattae BLCC-M143]